MDAKDYAKYIRTFRALGSEERLQIVSLLMDGPLCASDVEKQFYMEQSTTSHHLNTLKKAGILKSSKQGRHIYFSVDKPAMKSFYNDFLAFMGIING